MTTCHTCGSPKAFYRVKDRVYCREHEAEARTAQVNASNRYWAMGEALNGRRFPSSGPGAMSTRRKRGGR